MNTLVKAKSLQQLKFNPKRPHSRVLKLFTFILLANDRDFSDDEITTIDYLALRNISKHTSRYLEIIFSKRDSDYIVKDDGIVKLGHLISAYYNTKPKWVLSTVDKQCITRQDLEKKKKPLTELKSFHKPKSVIENLQLDISYDHLSTAELCAVAKILADYLPTSFEDRLLHFILLCSVFLGLPCSNLRQIRFTNSIPSDAPEQDTLWIEPNLSMWAFGYKKSTNENVKWFINQQPLHLPLPSLFRPYMVPEFVTLWIEEVDNIDYNKLRNLLLRLRPNRNEHRLNLSNLHSSFNNAVYQLCGLVPSCYLGFQRYHPSLLNNYTTITNLELIRHYSHTIKELGLEVDSIAVQRLERKPPIDYGSKRTVDPSLFGKLYCILLDHCRIAKKKHFQNSSLSSLIELFNAFSDLYLYIIVLSTNMRPVLGMSAIQTNYLNEIGIALISDKAKRHQDTSIRGLSTLAREALVQHKSLLVYLNNQLAKKFGITKSPFILSLNKLLAGSDRYSYFFKLNTHGETYLVEPYFLKNLFLKHLNIDIPNNSHRHVFASWGAVHRKTAIEIRAAMGHARRGQEPLTINTNLSLQVIGDSLQKVLDQYFTFIGIGENRKQLKAPHDRTSKIAKLNSKTIPFITAIPKTVDFKRKKKRREQYKEAKKSAEMILSDLGLNKNTVIYRDIISKCHDQINLIPNSRLRKRVRKLINEELNKYKNNNGVEPNINLYKGLDDYENTNKLTPINYGKRYHDAHRVYMEWLGLIKDMCLITPLDRFCSFVIYSAFHDGNYAENLNYVIYAAQSWRGKRTIDIGKAYIDMKRWRLSPTSFELLQSCCQETKLFSEHQVRERLSSTHIISYEELKTHGKTLSIVNNSGFETARRYLNYGVDFSLGRPHNKKSSSSQLDHGFDYTSKYLRKNFEHMERLKRLMTSNDNRLSYVSENLETALCNCTHEPTIKLLSWIISICKGEQSHRVRKKSGLKNYVRRALEFFTDAFIMEVNNPIALGQLIREGVSKDPSQNITVRTGKSISKFLSIYYRFSENRAEFKYNATKKVTVNCAFPYRQLEPNPEVLSQDDQELLFRIFEVTGIRMTERFVISTSLLSDELIIEIKSTRRVKNKTLNSNRAFALLGQNLSIAGKERIQGLLKRLEKNEQSDSEAIREFYEDVKAHISFQRHKCFTQLYLLMKVEDINSLKAIWELVRRASHENTSVLMRIFPFLSG